MESVEAAVWLAAWKVGPDLNQGLKGLYLEQVLS